MGKFYHSVSVVRPEHVRQWLWNHDPTAGLWFYQAVAKWLGSCGGSQPPLCLCCDHEFNDPKAPALTFFAAGVNLAKDGSPEKVIITGVCRNCATKSDDELM